MINLYNFGHVKKKSFRLRRVSIAVRVFSLISTLIFLVVSALALIFLFMMSILPVKYITAVVAVVAVLLAIGIIMFFVSKKHKAPAIIVGILLLIVSGFVCLGLGYLIKTRDFFSQTKAREYYVLRYSVFVLDESEYQTIGELSAKKHASYIDTDSMYNEAFDELKQEIYFETVVKNTFSDAAKALLNHEADFILLSDTYCSLLDDVIEDFSTKVRSIYDIDIKTYNVVEVSDVDVLKEPFNIYISGIDVNGDISRVSRSDVNMIVTVNPNTHKILLTSIPRDYYVQLHGTTGLRDKLTHSGIYGPTMTIKTVEDFMGIQMNYFVRVNFSSVINLVDAIGGIDITSDTTFRSWTNGACYFYAGNTSHEYGRCALAFARERKSYATGDIHRIQNQQQVMTAILNKLMSSEIIKKYTSVLSAVQDNFETNIPEQKIYQLINNQLDSMPKWQIEDYHLEGYDSYNSVYSYGLAQAGDNGSHYFVMEPNYETIEIARNKIKAIFDGE